jgi:predicted ATPase
VCCGADEAATLDLVDRLASKSLAVAKTAGGGTPYRLLETVRQYATGQR